MPSDRFTNMVSRCWELDEAGYIHRGQCCYVGWCIGIVSGVFPHLPRFLRNMLKYA